jgi:hypothetical protein|tara:strand:- start:3328 stop:4203 length:876 start_codon:yes stop_codon:yes gene_type:complete
MLMTNKSINLLQTNSNTIIYELIYTAIKCDVNSCIYREYSDYLSLCSNLIAFPLIILTSILGIVSTMQTVESTDTNNTNYLHTNTNFKIGISCLSILVAIMSGLQKYCKYAERTEITKNYAKNFEKLGHSIELFLYEIKSESITSNIEIFDKLISSMFRDFEILNTECDDEPCNMKDKQTKMFNEKSKILLDPTSQPTVPVPLNTNSSCCLSLRNCLSFLCTCCSYTYNNKVPKNNIPPNLIQFSNLDTIIKNLRQEYRRPVHTVYPINQNNIYVRQPFAPIPRQIVVSPS